jgi:uncharacterized membrane protein YhaH (DUF805 family)
MFEFLFPRRLHRLSYFFRLTAVNIANGILYGCGSGLDPRMIWSLIGASIVYCIFFIALPRMRDIGMNGWWVLLIFVPGADIIFSAILLFRAPAMLAQERRQPATEPLT